MTDRLSPPRCGRPITTQVKDAGQNRWWYTCRDPRCIAWAEADIRQRGFKPHVRPDDGKYLTTGCWVPREQVRVEGILAGGQTLADELEVGEERRAEG